MDRPSSPSPRLARLPSDAPELPSLAPLLDEARRADLDAMLVLSVCDDETNRALAKRRHDVKAALRTLGFSLKALETGYKFDDDKAAAKIDAIAKAVQVLEREAAFALQVLKLD